MPKFEIERQIQWI